MNRKMIHTVLLVCALMPAMAQAFGNHDTWTSGWGQGVSEFVIKGKGQSQLYLACDDAFTTCHPHIHGRQRAPGQHRQR